MINRLTNKPHYQCYELKKKKKQSSFMGREVMRGTVSNRMVRKGLLKEMTLKQT